MAKIRPDLETSRWGRFVRWLSGGSTALDDELQREYELTSGPFARPGMAHHESMERQREDRIRENLRQMEELQDQYARSHSSRWGKRLYGLCAVLLCVGIIGILLVTAGYLPSFGSGDTPVNNEVSRRYIEQGQEETGAVNIVAGMILDYRAFDTLGESHVLFVAACTVIILLRICSGHEDEAVHQLEMEADDRMYEPKNDPILQHAVSWLLPFILLFGAYIILNGHISPGGGFSGGAVMGAGLILYLNAFGFKKAERFFTFRTFRVVSLCALSFYALSKTYSFFTGANHLPSVITPGTPGRIFSAGLIPYLNIAVGLVVCCTMYAFYTLFRKGDM